MSIRAPLRPRETIDGVVTIDSIRGQPRAWKIRSIGSVGPDLRFQTDGVGLPVKPPALSSDRAVKIVSRIDLQAWLVGQKLEDTPRARRLEPRCKPQRASVVQTEIVVVTLAVARLLIVVADARADRRRFAEIERRAGDGLRRHGQGNCGLIGHQEMI